jgi:hypothetical protein
MKSRSGIRKKIQRRQAAPSIMAQRVSTRRM